MPRYTNLLNLCTVVDKCEQSNVAHASCSFECNVFEIRTGEGQSSYGLVLERATAASVCASTSYANKSFAKLRVRCANCVDMGTTKSVSEGLEKRVQWMGHYSVMGKSPPKLTQRIPLISFSGFQSFMPLK